MCHWGVLFLRIFVGRQLYTFLAVGVEGLVVRTDTVYRNITVFPMPKNSPCPWRIVFGIGSVCFGVSNAVERVCS